MKKEISLLVSVVMIVSAFAMAVSADSLQDRYLCLLEYDFESGDFPVGRIEEDIPNGPGFTHNDNQVIEDIGGEHGKVLSFNHPADNKDRVALNFVGKDSNGNKGWKAIGRKLTLNMDLYIKGLDRESDDYNFEIYHVPDGGNLPASNHFMIFGYQGTIWGNNGHVANGYTTDEWFHLALEYDMDNNCVKAYINGEFIMEDLICAEGTNMSDVFVMRFIAQFRNRTHEGQKVMMDNIVVGDTFGKIGDGSNQPADTGNTPDTPDTFDILTMTAVIALTTATGVIVSKKKHR